MERSATHEERPHSPYCLACYAPMVRDARTSHRCERCGFVNLRLDQELFWTKEPRLVELESCVKVAIVFLLLALTGLMFWAMGQRASFGMGQGWAIGFPILLGVLLWDTASAITRRASDHRGTIVWRIVCAVLTPWPFLLVIDGAQQVLRGKGLPTGTAIFVLALFLGTVFLSGALGLGRFGRALLRWRERRIRAAQLALSAH